MAERVAQPHRPLTVEEYLALEESATRKHEYVAGEIHAHAGASRRHNLIVSNVSGYLWNAARGGPCRIYSSDMKLRVAADTFYYPDVMVACDSDEDDPNFEETPCVVVEVTSPSTEATDRREKLASYKGLSSLRAYLIVSQEERRVERHWHDEGGAWWHADLSGEGRVPVPCPEMELTLGGIYEGL